MTQFLRGLFFASTFSLLLRSLRFPSQHHFGTSQCVQLGLHHLGSARTCTQNFLPQKGSTSFQGSLFSASIVVERQRRQRRETLGTRLHKGSLPPVFFSSLFRVSEIISRYLRPHCKKAKLAFFFLLKTVETSTYASRVCDIQHTVMSSLSTCYPYFQLLLSVQINVTFRRG